MEINYLYLLFNIIDNLLLFISEQINRINTKIWLL